MKKTLLAFFFLFAGSANAAILTFDDIATDITGDVGTYQGYNFSTDLDYFDMTMAGLSANSGDYAVTNNGITGTGRRSQHGDFTFGGLYALDYSGSSTGK